MKFLARYCVRVSDPVSGGEAYRTSEEKVFEARDKEEARKMADKYGEKIPRRKLIGASVVLEGLVEVKEKVFGKK